SAGTRRCSCHPLAPRPEAVPGARQARSADGGSVIPPWVPSRSWQRGGNTEALPVSAMHTSAYHRADWGDLCKKRERVAPGYRLSGKRVCVFGKLGEIGCEVLRHATRSARVSDPAVRPTVGLPSAREVVSGGHPMRSRQREETYG